MPNKPIIQIQDGKRVFFDSVTAAAVANKTSPIGIIGCAKGYFNQWLGSKFVYALPKQDIVNLSYYILSHTPRTIKHEHRLGQYTIHGELVNEYPSVRDALAGIGQDPDNKNKHVFMYSAIRADSPTAYGWVWRWL